MIRFAAISDLQYGDFDKVGNRAYRESISKFLISVGEFVNSDVDFAMNFGDSCQSGFSNHLAIVELYRLAEKYGAQWRHVLGNHDFLVNDAQKKDVYANLGLEKPGYYSFSISDKEDAANKWRFVVLNGNEISEYAAETDEERDAARREREARKLADGSLPYEWNGSLSRKQLDWLDSQLQEAEDAQENAAICSHFPLFASSKSFESRSKLAALVDLGVYYSDLGVSTWNGREILEILDKRACVRAYFAGHLHEGSYGVRRGVAHVTFNGAVEAEPYAHAFVELTSKSIKVKGFGAQPSYMCEF